MVHALRQKRIVFLGNCQAASMANLYKRYVGGPEQQIVNYIPSYDAPGENGLLVLENADIIVQQVLDFAPTFNQFSSNAQLILFPHVSAPFLWPCSGRTHPKNKPIFKGEQSGPYNAELGDSALDRLIGEGRSPELAVDEYMNTDIAASRRVERMLTLCIDRQKTRDQLCGVEFADDLSLRFRSEALFRTANHPSDAFAIEMAICLFLKLDIASEVIETIIAEKPSKLFPGSECPVHPSVINQFGISWVNDDSRYMYFDEGRFTAREFALRYMTYDYDEHLPVGMALAHEGKLQNAYQELLLSTAKSPRSSIAHWMLAEVSSKLGLLENASVLATQAHNLDPANQHIATRMTILREAASQTVA